MFINIYFNAKLMVILLAMLHQKQILQELQGELKLIPEPAIWVFNLVKSHLMVD